MTKLSYTLGMKVFACFIAVLSGITAFFDGIGIFLANSYGFYSSFGLSVFKAVGDNLVL